MIIENETALDCIDALIFGINRTCDWRRKMAAKYPGDPRNARAADCLTKLAADATALTDEDWLRLKSHAGWANLRFREAISDVSRSVGFKKKITDLSSFVQALLEVLAQPQSNAT